MARSKWAIAPEGRSKREYEVPYAKKQRLKRKAKAKVLKRGGKRVAKNRQVGGDFWGDVGNFFTKTLPDVAMTALPILLTML
jgi:hypothetical protein